ncbi:DUF5988 family protein [Dactylosporangium cerinum]|uniref:DUF5988 family protein n=1 Tax=Dactylosporangium cerinum TaxID=1434730 RepID=A0ABV9WMU6_9ACTN
MEDYVSEMVYVRLEGGPQHMPPAMRDARASASDLKIKLEYYGGYEHFERVTTGDVDASPVVFQWTGRTRIAE